MSIGEYYHVYNRGVDKRDIFHDDHDRNRFVALLFLCNCTDPVNIEQLTRSGRTFRELWSVQKSEPIVDIGAYCLMPNHYHILIRERTEHGTSVFMRKLGTAYSMYYNTKRTRTGTLFEGRFKIRHVNNDTHLRYLFAYIHLNPAKMVQPAWEQVGVRNTSRTHEHLQKYRYSSYLDYLSKQRPENAVLNRSAFPGYFEDPVDLEKLINDCAAYREQSANELRADRRKP
jgi:putative transposase